ncbi:hypothetical protein HUO14_11905 [Parasphingorhabdus flavimaris]|uniref:PurM-like N-terminal domain-containing protein n=1 Tax=Parasphingorhabdus flavimaris TaxID=266812 RepID=A0ABX2N4G9_9SPHN|nr:AIR synthase related protein [Parasphingorhabdus flavimaris]NVD28607.1 hypothetical protein [Parasphingorhabdus flavimaris]
MSIVDPQHFGCSAKLPFDENERLAEIASDFGFGCRDFSRLNSDKSVIQSIDKVSRCSESWNKFATIAIVHGLNDIVAGGADPEQLMIAFEFGPDAESSNDRENATKAFLDVASHFGFHVGKCHSSVGYGPTSVTIACIGRQAKADLPEIGTEGQLFLSNPLGAFKVHYLAELGSIPDDRGAYDVMKNRMSEYSRVSENSTVVTDVTGHSFLGQIMTFAHNYNVDIDIALKPQHMFHAEVLGIPVECLQNEVGQYGHDVRVIDDIAGDLAVIKETAGPFLALKNSEFCTQNDPMSVGHFRDGSGKVELKWIK